MSSSSSASSRQQQPINHEALSYLETQISNLHAYLDQQKQNQQSQLECAPTPGIIQTLEQQEVETATEAKQLDQLTTFNFSHQPINVSTMNTLLSLFSSSSSSSSSCSSSSLFPFYLRHLHFSTSSLTPSTFHLLSSFLLSLSPLHLHSFSLSYNPFTASVLPTLTTFFLYHPHLTVHRLDLGGCGLGDQGLAELITVISQAQQQQQQQQGKGEQEREKGKSGEGLGVHTLLLNSNDLGDHTVSAIAAWLHSPQGCTLTSLSLANNHITDTGASILGVALARTCSSNNPSSSERKEGLGLLHLDVSSNELSSVGLSCLREALRSNWHICSLLTANNRTASSDRVKQSIVVKEIDELLVRNKEERRKKHEVAFLEGFHARMGCHSTVKRLKDEDRITDEERKQWCKQIFEFVGPTD